MSDRFDPYHVWLGIPSEEQPPNHYRLLGLRLFEANADVISNALDQRRAFLRSVSAGKRAAQSQQLLNAVSAAGVCLLDPSRKARYDDELRMKIAMTAEPSVGTVSDLGPLPPETLLPASVIQIGSAEPLATAPAVSGQSPELVLNAQQGKSIPPVITRRKKSQSPPAAAMVAIVLLGLGVLGMVIGGGAWWAISQRKSLVMTPTPQPQTPPTGTSDGNTSVSSASAALPQNLNPTLKGGRPVTEASQQRLALVFSGQETVQIPLPQQGTSPETDFTVEVWALWDPYEPAGRLLGSGPFRVHSTGIGDESAPGAFNVIHLGAGMAGTFRRADIVGGRWTHVAVVNDSDGAELFVNGKPSLKAKPKAKPGLGPTLVLGDVASQNPAAPRFAGLIRDIRVSKGRRYSGPFTPEPTFSLDAQTLVLPRLQFPVGRDFKIENLVGSTAPVEWPQSKLLLLTADGDVAAEQPDGTVDLLKTLNVARGTLEGDNFQTAAYAETRIAAGRSRMLLPYRPPAEYEVALDVTRQEGNGGVLLGLEIAGQLAILAIDIPVGAERRTGLLPADLSDMAGAPLLRQTPPLLATGERRQVLVKVQLKGTDFSIVAENAGTAIASVVGPLEELDCAPVLAIPLGHGMSLGSLDAKVRFERVVLRPTNKTFTPQVLANMHPAQPRAKNSIAKKTGKAKKVASSSAGSESDIATQKPPNELPLGSRRPVPSGEVLSKAVEEARAIYEADFKAATKAPQKTTLAARIFDVGKGTTNDPTARYVLLDLARKVFVQAGEVSNALAAARILETDYEIPRDELAGATVEALDDATLSAEQRAELAKAAAELADAALESDKYERADKLSAIASQSAGRQRDADLKKEMAQRRAQVVKLVKDWNVAKASLEKLKSDPADATASLAAGKFYGFALEDFSQGLKYLAGGSDPQLAEAAKRDLEAQGGDPAKRFAAATAWQQAAAKISDREDKLAAQRREKWLLQQAVSGLSGLDQIKANKRLEELKEVEQVRTKTSVAGSSARSAARSRNASMVGRLVSGTTDLGLFISYEHGYVITSDDVGRMLKAANATSPQNLKLALVGGFYLPTDQTITLHQIAESNSGAMHRVQIDNRNYSTLSAGRTNETRGVRLPAGNHIVRWELTGNDLGTAVLELRSDAAVTGGTQMLIPVTVDRSLETAARQQPTRANIHFGPSR